MNFFRMWELLEADYRVVGSTDPVTMAGNWDRMAPHEPAQNLVNLGEVWKLVRALSNNQINRVWMNIFKHEPIPGYILFQGNLADFIKTDGVEGSIVGGISPDPEFYCHPEKVGDKIVSEVMIAPPPVEYDNEERAMLSSIVIHELRHAIDFHEFKKTMDMDYYRKRDTHIELDMDLYARNIFEARAHADQVKILITTLGDGERAKRVIRESILARGFIPRLRESMLELVDILCGLRENTEPTVMVARDENKIEQVVELVRHICESFKFSRFVKFS